MQIKNCPDPGLLASCAAGTLSDADAESVFTHVGECAYCLKVLDSLASGSESLAERLREAADERYGLEAPEPLQRVLQKVMSGEDADRLPSVARGSMIGEYCILEEIGRGGLGRVYLASHPRLERHVAVKMLAHALVSPEIHARFIAERRVLERMDHPHIAQVLDGGLTNAGCPYFVMEYVKGKDIIQHCDERCMTISERLELFLQVCDAVHHAHQKAVIHRDLKPSNVLVTNYDGRSAVKVIDFGIARLNDEANPIITQDGVLIGTPHYMSPEQAALTAASSDVRSDVFSLGVVLFELVCGSTPFQSRGGETVSVFELLRRIREDEAAAPFMVFKDNPRCEEIASNRSSTKVSLPKQLSGELTWIIQRSLEKQPERRYGSVYEFAADIRNYLNNQPLIAGPPSPSYRLRKLIRRNRGVSVLMALLFISLVCGSIGTTWGLFAAIQQQKQTAFALAGEKREREARTRLLEQERQSRERADAAVERTLEALQTLTEDTVSRLLFSKPELTDDDRRFLDSIISQFEEFSKSTNGSFRARVVEAEGHHRIAILRWKIGEREQSAAGYRRAIELWQKLCSEDPLRHDLRRAMADSYSNLGIVLNELRQFEDAEEAHLKGISIHEQLAVEFPSEPSYRKNLANCRVSYGVMLKDLQRNTESLDQYRKAVQIQDELLKADPANEDLLNENAGARNNLGLELLIANQREESLSTFKEAIRLMDQLVSRQPMNADLRFGLASTHSNVGLLFAQAGEFEEAIASLETGRTVLTAISSEFPAVVRYRNTLMNSLRTISQLQLRLKRYPEAETTTRQYIDVVVQLSREDAQNDELVSELGRAHILYSTVLQALQRLDESAEASQKGIGAVRELLERQRGASSDRSDLIAYLLRHVLVFRTVQPAEDSVAMCREALGIFDDGDAQLQEDPKLRGRRAELQKLLEDLTRQP